MQVSRPTPGVVIPRTELPYDGLDRPMADFRHRSCCLKQRYNSLDAAAVARQELREKFPDGPLLHAYYCYFCNDFHLGRPFKKFDGGLDDLERQLRFDFLSPCHHCGKALRFTGRGQPAAGRGGGKPSADFMRRTAELLPSTDCVQTEVAVAQIDPLPPPSSGS